ncbi:hypothetical protein CFC21_101001 [Triticum aestivum]|uniref:WAT1-related protein n=3 Tax=Triticum TaxID=4564 RepID=A0A9R0ZSR1_TRITD|nr:WAT1-related protein At5g64700-like isoform X2 [Triticum aestivum]KAF7099364.1 hypothetical protein CFC21_101001 [Triticum aestivum]VAI82433.1 unnamed protein product [Triticum turgidum subsp. durum]
MDIRAGAPEAKAGREWGLPASMVLVQLFMAGMIVLSKVSIAGGMFIFALLAYRGLLGAAFVVPFALGYERGKWREMDWHATGWIFLNALIGYTMPMSLYYYGLRDTTPSYAAIFMNISPLLTFILSLIFRMETLQIRSIVGSLKIVGIMLSIGGTMLISLYKGKILHLWDPILEHHHRELTTKVAGNQLRGTIFLAGSSFTFSCWYLTQGVLATAGRYCMTLWVVSKRGPTYPPMFNPLSVVFTILLDSIFIGDEITVGSLVGTAMAIVGLYIFIWGKSKEVNEK